MERAQIDISEDNTEDKIREGKTQRKRGFLIDLDMCIEFFMELKEVEGKSLSKKRERGLNNTGLLQ